ncbi:hypothetical protein [Latilactobacillus curvatus]
MPEIRSVTLADPGAKNAQSVKSNVAMRSLIMRMAHCMRPRSTGLQDKST